MRAMNPMMRGAESDGDYVKLQRLRYAVAKACFSAGIRPGCLTSTAAGRHRVQSGCNQELTHKQIGDWSCPTYAYHDVLCQMEKWEEE
ncbi:MAG: hypothetical protein ACLU6V_00540 [Lancefieldella rimae]